MSNRGFNFKFPSDYAATVGTTSTGLIVYTTDIQLPVSIQPNMDATYLITAYNASTATDVTVTVQNLHKLFGPSSTDIWADLTSISVALTTSTTLGTRKDTLVQGWLIGSGIGRLKLSNVSTGSSDLNAACYFRVTKV